MGGVKNCDCIKFKIAKKETGQGIKIDGKIIPFSTVSKECFDNTY